MPDSRSRRGNERRSAAPLLTGVAVVWIVLDQLCKQWAIAALPERTAVPIVGDVLQLFLTYNPGAAFSMLPDATWVFTLLSAAVVAGIAWQIPKVYSRLWACVIGLLLGGAAGNLIDRLFRAPGFPSGHVVDMISTPWLVPAVYNVADAGLVVAVCCTVLLLLKGVPLGAPVAGAARQAEAETAVTALENPAEANSMTVADSIRTSREESSPDAH